MSFALEDLLKLFDDCLYSDVPIQILDVPENGEFGQDFLLAGNENWQELCGALFHLATERRRKFGFGPTASQELIAEKHNCIFCSRKSPIDRLPETLTPLDSLLAFIQPVFNPLGFKPPCKWAD